MKTVGEIIREARVAKKYSFAKLEEKTKIKKSFIQAIENSGWKDLPEYAVVAGFVKSLANALGTDPEKLVAVLRRDYPPKVVNINPKPDVDNRFGWSPKLTFITGIILVVLAISSYLGYQYYRFIAPPKLEVATPREEEVVFSGEIEVTGKADPDAAVTVNSQPVIISDNGIFSTDLKVDEKTDEIVVIAKSRSGKETKIVRKIKVGTGLN
jgi:transcriptional regulator with XRE-family HTH domain